MAALLSNWEQVEAAVKSATEAEGSAATEHEKYLDSIQGHIDSLISSWQKLSNTVLETDFLKGGLDFLTGVLDTLDAVIDKFGVFPTLMGTIAGVLSAKNDIGIFSLLNAELKKTTSKLIGVSDQVKIFGKSFNLSHPINQIGIFGKSLSDITRDLKSGQGVFKSFFSNLIYKDGISNADVDRIREFTKQVDSGISVGQAWKNTMSDASVAAKKMARDVRSGSVSIDSLTKSANRSKIAMGALKVASIALNAALSMGLSLAIQGVITLFDKLVNAAKYASEEANDMRNEMTQLAEAAVTEADEIDLLISRYKALSEADTRNVDTINQLRDIQKEITSLVGDQANNLDLVNGNHEEQLDKLYEIQKVLLDNAKYAAMAAYDSAKEASEKDVGDAKGSFLHPAIGGNYVHVGKSDKKAEQILKASGFGLNVQSGGWLGNTTYITANYTADGKLVDNAEEGAEVVKLMMKSFEDAEYTNNEVYRNLRKQAVSYQQTADEVTTSVDTALDTVINSAAITNEKFTGIAADSADAFAEGRSILIDAVKNSPEISSIIEDGYLDDTAIEDAITDYMSQMDGFADYYDQWALGFYNKFKNSNIDDITQEQRQKVINSFANSDIKQWFDGLSEEDKKIIYQVDVEGLETGVWKLEQWKQQLIDMRDAGAKSSAESMQSFYAIMNDDSEGSFSETIASYVDQAKSLESYLDALDTGQYTSEDLMNLALSFPEIKSFGIDFEDIANGTVDIRDLELAIGDLILSTRDGLDAKFKEQIAAVGGEATTAGQQILAIQKMIEDSVSAFDGWQFNMENMKTNYSNLQAIMGESVSPTGLSSDGIRMIESMFHNMEGYDPSVLFEKTEHGIHLNTEALRLLKSQYEATDKAVLQGKLHDLGLAYEDTYEELGSLTQGTAEWYDKLADLEAIQAQIQEVEILATQYEGLTSSYNKWVEAQSTTNEGNMYDTIVSAMENVGKLYDENRVNTDDFREFVQMFYDEDLSAASSVEISQMYEKALPSVERYFASGQAGMGHFLEDLNKINAELAHQNADGFWELNFGVSDSKEIANAFSDMLGLQMSAEATEIIIRRMAESSSDIDLGSPLEFASLEELKSVVDETEAKLKELGENPVDINTNLTGVEEILTEIERANQLKSEIESDQSLDIEVKTAQLDDANTKIDVLVGKVVEANQLPFLDIDTSKVSASFVEVLELLQEYQTVKDNLTAAELKFGIDSEEYRQFEEQLDTILQKIQQLDGDTKASIGLEVDGSLDSIEDQLNKDSNTIAMKITGDTDQLKEDIENVDGGTAEVDVEANTEQAEKDIDDLGEEPIKTKLVVDTDQAKKDVDDFKETVKDPIIAELDADTEKASTEINQLAVKTMTVNVNANTKSADGQISQLDNDTLTVKVDANTEKAKEKINQLDDDGLTVDIDADVNKAKKGIDQLDEDVITVEVDGNTNKLNAAINGYDNKELVVDFKTNTAEVDEKINSLKNEKIETEAKIDWSNDTSAVDEYSKKEKTSDGTVDWDNNTEEVDEYAEEEKESDGTVTWDNNTKKVDSFANTVQEAVGIVTWQNDSSNLQTQFTANGTVNWSNSGGTSSSSSSNSSGSGGFFSRIKKAISGLSFAEGDWKLKNSGEALGGELGEEMIVRDGRYFTIGKDSAEFFKYKKGDIIFNAEQTKELLEKGKITNGNRRGKVFAGNKTFISNSDSAKSNAFAQGNAFSEGNAFAPGSSFFASGKPKGSIVFRVGGQTVTSSAEIKKAEEALENAKKTKDTLEGAEEAAEETADELGNAKDELEDANEEAEEFKETFDWVEVAIDRAERAINRLDLQANSIYNSWSTRNGALKGEISAITDAIGVQSSAYSRYMQEANSVGLSSEWVSRVQSGAFDISTIEDEELAEQISLYSEWYNKALDCQDAIDSLNESLSECYKSAFDNVAAEYDGILSIVDHTQNMINEYINQAEAQGYLISTEYYKGLIETEEDKISKLQSEKAELLSALQDAMQSGTIEQNSEAWYDMVQQIDSVTLAIEEANTAILEYTNSIRDFYIEFFEDVASQYSNIFDTASYGENLIHEYITQTETDDGIVNPKYYDSLIEIEQSVVQKLKREREDLVSAFEDAMGSGLIKEGSDEWHSMIQQINDVSLAIQESNTAVLEYLEAIKEYYIKTFDDIASQYDNILSLKDYTKDITNEYVNQAEAERLIPDPKYYELLMKNEEKIIKKLREERETLTGFLSLSLASGSILEGTDEWYDMINKIDEITLSIEESNTAIIEYTNAIRDYYVEYFNLIDSQYDNMHSLSEYTKNILNEYKAQSEALGYITSPKYYQALIKNEEKIISELKREKNDLLDFFNVAMNSGLIEKGSDEWFDMIGKIDEITLAIEQSHTAIIEYGNAIKEYYVDVFNHIASQYDNILSLFSHSKNMLNEFIRQDETKGYVISAKYYEALIKNEEGIIARLKQEKADLLSAFEEAMDTGAVEEASDEWFSMVNQIDGVTLAIEQSNTAMLEFANAIRDIEWQIFDLLQDKISNITKEADFLIDLMDSDKLYDDHGQLTNEGMSTMGLHGVNYNVYMEQADDYAEEIIKIEKEIAKNPYSQDIIERKEELIELQQESILAAKAEKDAIVDMVREGIELELDALQELISAYSDALDSEKD